MTHRTIEDRFRDETSKILPDAFAQALKSYEKYMKANIPIDDPKKFYDRHKAAKAAIAHLKLLLAFARLVNLPDPRAADHNNQILLAAVMQEAQEEVQQYDCDIEADYEVVDEDE